MNLFEKKKINNAYAPRDKYTIDIHRKNMPELLTKMMIYHEKMKFKLKFLLIVK